VSNSVQTAAVNGAQAPTSGSETFLVNKQGERDP
jgi:hypothetical protein